MSDLQFINRGGGGAVTIADGADVTLGAKADAKSTATDVTPVTAMQVLKEISYMVQNPASTPVTAASLPLPTGAATSANQTNASQKTQVVDGIGNVIGSTSNALDINIKSGNPTTITATQSVASSLKTEAHLFDSSINGITSTGNALDINIKSGNPTSITANAGTNLNTSALALESGGNLAKLPLAQASITSGQSGPLIQGAVTTGAPTYISGQTDPLSLNTSGGLRVDGSGVTQPVSIASMPSTPVTGTFWQTTQPVSMADGQQVTLGAKADAKNSATDTTAITFMQVLKQMSYELQAPTDHTNNIEKVQVQVTHGTVLTASGQVKGSAGQLMGYVVNSFTSGATIKVWDSLSAAGTVVFDTQTFTTQLAPFVFCVPAVLMTTGIYFTLSGTISVTPLYN